MITRDRRSVKFTTNAHNEKMQLQQNWLKIGITGKDNVAWCIVPETIHLKKILRDYAAKFCVSLGSIQFEPEGSKVFLSDLRQRTVGVYGLKDDLLYHMLWKDAHFSVDRIGCTRMCQIW